MSRNRKRRNKSNTNFPQQQPSQIAKPEIVKPVIPGYFCPVCNTPIEDVYSACTHAASGQPAHFDCICKEILANESLAEGERLSYLGSGLFAIIQDAPPGHPAPFVIKKRIPYEKREQSLAWRKDIQYTAQ